MKYSNRRKFRLKKKCSRVVVSCEIGNMCNGMFKGEVRWRDIKIFEEIVVLNLVIVIKL